MDVDSENEEELYQDVEVTFTKSTGAYAATLHESDWLWTIRAEATLEAQGMPSMPAGRLKAYRSNFEAFYRSGHNLFDAFDQHSQELMLMAAAFMDREGDWHPSIYRQFGGIIEADLIYIDRLWVDPLLRGKRLGLALVERCITMEANGCGLVVLDPLPEEFYLNPETGEPKTLQRPDIQRAMKRVRTYFAQMGFEKVRRGRYLALNPSYQHPSPEDLDLSYERLEIDEPI